MWSVHVCFFFFRQKTAYGMRISDWSSDVCSSDLELVIDGSAANVGPYAFRLLDGAASATPVAGNGDSVTGTLTPASETHVYALDLAAGETFVFDARVAPGSG